MGAQRRDLLPRVHNLLHHPEGVLVLPNFLQESRQRLVKRLRLLQV